jgi:hypothetical protein
MVASLQSIHAIYLFLRLDNEIVELPPVEVSMTILWIKKVWRQAFPLLGVPFELWGAYEAGEATYYCIVTHHLRTDRFRLSQHAIQALFPLLSPTLLLAHDLFKLGTDALKFVPIPGLDAAATLLLNIWDNMRDVKVRMILFACVPPAQDGYPGEPPRLFTAGGTLRQPPFVRPAGGA